MASTVLSPSTFITFVSVDKPFRISSLNPIEGDGWYPEKVGVTVQTDLSYKMPVAQGELVYKKVAFASKLSQMIDQLPGLPNKYRSKK